MVEDACLVVQVLDGLFAYGDLIGEFGKILVRSGILLIWVLKIFMEKHFCRFGRALQSCIRRPCEVLR